MTQSLGFSSHWFSSSSAAAVTHSTIQCTRFYGSPEVRWPQRPSRSSSLLSRYATQGRTAQLHRGYTRYKSHSPHCRTRPSSAYISPASLEATESGSEVGADKRVTINLLGRTAETSPCLERHLAENIQARLPPRVALATHWRLLFSLDQHGASLKTLYRRAQLHSGPCILVIHTADDEIFGAYLSESLKEQESMHYYGSGECFLWALDDAFQLKVFPWTCANDYMALSNRDFIALGGGNGRFGLWLHADLTHGHSEPCATYGNPRLAKAADFECVGLEVWGFQF